MNFGQTVEFIRHQKNFSIKQVCGDYLSRQTYYRFVKNEIDISSTKLFFLLDRLNVNVDEFLFISNNFQLPKEFSDMEKVKFYFENSQINELRILLDNYASQTNVKEKVLFALISVLVGRLMNHTSFEEEKILRDYLMNIETWTHYETVLFNNSMFIFNSDFIDLVFAKVNFNLEKYSTLRYYGNESIKMLINMVILYIDRKDLKRAQKTLSTIKTIKLNDDCLYEKTCIIFFSEILDFLNGKTDSLEVCKSIIQHFNLVESNSIAKMFELYLDNILKNYPCNNS